MTKYLKNLLALLCITALQMSNAFACDITLSPGIDNIQPALATPGISSVCLSPGGYVATTNITVSPGQLLIGTGNTDDATITSAAQYAVTLLSNATVARLHIDGAPANKPDFGVIVGSSSGATAWGLRVTNTKIGLGTNGASNVNFLSNWVTNIGIGGDGIAQPSHWINASSGVTIRWGEFYGDSSQGSGDGEIAAYDSTNVTVDSVYQNWSGAAGVYMVNCDSCSVINSFIRYAGEYGIDVVGGSNGFYANNNEVSNSNYGAIAYDVVGGSTATVTNNILLYNGFPGCNGVKVLSGDPNNVTMSGNYAQVGHTIGYFDIKC